MFTFPASFSEPTMEMTATCPTKGAFPNLHCHGAPDVWTSEIQEGDGIISTVSTVSTISIAVSKKATCSVYNPTSNWTVRATTELPAGAEDNLINIHTSGKIM